MRTDIHLERHLVLGALLALVGAGAAVASTDGRSPADLATEKFLATAEVVDDEPVGEGITRPRRLTLHGESRDGRAIFKAVDEHTNELVRNRGLEVGFSDCFRYEVAAYRLDRWLGLGLVPVTVVREVGGATGSLQEWVEDVRSFRRAAEEPDSCAGADLEQTRGNLTRMYVFDQVIANTDRTWDNILVEPERNRFYLIDHSRSFRTSHKAQGPYHQGMAKVPVELVSRLRGLDRETVDELLGDLLSSPQRRAIAARAEHLLTVLARAGMLPPVTERVAQRRVDPAS